jgi:hypothetical protein
MAIQINGNGTITGISVGGLPDGIVDTDMIAANAVTPAKSTISGGKIKQIVQATSHTRLDTTSTTYVASAHSITITPTVANSKILVNFTLTINTNGTNHRAYVDIYRSINGGTFTGIAPVGSNETIGANNNAGFFGQIRADSSRMQAPTHIHYLDSPSYSLGNAIVYKLYARSSNSANTIEVPSSSNSEPVVMMLTEVGA